ncbi:hypothetical protein HMPREF9374_3414 [Desmospora sp. 8437]|nr:hypothetical protein HMPREF9374_3414 [Desmospora sp. 8437]
MKMFAKDKKIFFTLYHPLILLNRNRYIYLLRFNNLFITYLHLDIAYG